MNLLAARVVLRPRSLAEVLDLAVPFCLAGKRVMGRLAALVLAPALAVCAGLRWGFGWQWQSVMLVALVLGDVVEGAFTCAAGELLFREPRDTSAAAILARFIRRLPRAFAALVVCRVLLAVALPLVVTLPMVALRLLFTREVVLLEEAGPFAALGRSHRLVKNHSGKGIGLLTALSVGPALFVVGAEQLGQGAVGTVLQAGAPFGRLFQEGGSLFALAGFFLSVPVLATARFLAYIDLRTRKEGWDIQLRFAALAAAARPPEESSAA
jgi:hypothetical protein